MRSHPTLVYTLSRVLLFLAVLGVLYLLGARDLVLLVLAFLISGAISLVLLSRQRDAMSSSVTGTFRRINERIEASSRAEDEDGDQDEDGDPPAPGGVDDDAPPPSATAT
jgi:hypothetical protein